MVFEGACPEESGFGTKSHAAQLCQSAQTDQQTIFIQPSYQGNLLVSQISP